MLRRLVIAVVLFALVPPAAAGASARDCPKRKDTIARAPLGRVWHQSASVYACTTVYGHRPRARRLGPWKRGTVVAFDGVNVVWTVPLVRAGVRSDRLWAANADDGARWLGGGRLVPAPAGVPEHEGRIARLVQSDQGAAWLTRTGEVGMLMRAPQDDPVAFGGLAEPAPNVGPDTTRRVLVGAFGAAAVPALAASLTLVELPGEGDECGAINPYRLTFRATEAGPDQGVEWQGGWTSTNC